VQSLLGTWARAEHSPVDAPLRAVQCHLHSCASRPEGPANRVVCKEAERMALTSMESNTTECISEGEGMMHSGLACRPWGCLLMRVSLTEGFLTQIQVDILIYT
jgi:hypothetical protein